MKSSKIASIVLSAATITSLFASPLLPIAQAQSTADLQAQIAALLAQIQILQGKLGTGSGSMTTTSCSFTRDLTVGSRGDDVTALQQILWNGGYLKVNPTGYFGSLTKAAVVAWQKAANVSPAAGYFGPKSRAAIASSCTGTGTGTGGGTGTGTPIPGSGLSVSLASDNPTNGSLISSSGASAARVPVLAVNFTAGTASGVTVTGVNFQKVGVLSDSSISGAYLIENGKVIAQYNAITSGKIQFSNLSWNIAAGQTRKVWLAIDPASGLSAGNTVGFSLASADDIMSVDANNASVTESGSFPLTGSTFTVTTVSNPSLGSITVASSSIGTQVTAGTTGNVVGAWTFTAANNKQWLKGINFKVIGSANKTDIRNVMLKVNGVAVGSPLTSVAADGTAYFDLSATPATLNTGANNVQVFADITGSPSYNFQFEILNSYDVYVVDSVYNVPVTAGSNTGTQVTILTGSITVTQASDTPTGNVAKGQTGVTFAKFNVYAAGEPVKVKWLTFKFVFTGGTGATLDSYIKNVHLDDDAGQSIGTTINSLATSVTCTDTSFSAATTTAVNCFGNSSSPINYIVPANTTRVLSLRGDVQSTADFTSVVASLTGNTSNLQGLTSSQTASSGAVSGSSLALSANSLTVAKNSGLGTQNLAAQSLDKRIGSYAFTASSAEGVNISTVTVTMGTTGSAYQNVKVKVGSSQFGTTQNTVANSGVYTFSGTPFLVPAGQTTIVDIYADVLSTATTTATATSISGVSGTGASSLTAISLSSTVAGQGITINATATVQVGIDGSNNTAAPTGQVVMGSTGQTLAVFRFTETSNVEEVNLKNLNVFQQVSATTSVKASFENLRLYKSSDLTTPLATAGSALDTNQTTTTAPHGRYYKFSFGTPVTIPKAGSLALVLKGDVSTYDSGAATDNSTHLFKIATTTDSDNDTLAETVDAKGATSNTAATISFATGTSAPSANVQTVLRTKLTVTTTPQGSQSTRSKATSDNLLKLKFSSDALGNASLNTVTLTFSGSLPSNADFLSGVRLVDTGGNNVSGYSGVTVASSSACTGGSSTCTVTWTFGAAQNGLSINSSGTEFTLQVDSLNRAQAGIANVSHSLTAAIAANTDVVYATALDSSASTNISLPASAVSSGQLTNSFIYGVGQ